MKTKQALMEQGNQKAITTPALWLHTLAVCGRVCAVLFGMFCWSWMGKCGNSGAGNSETQKSQLRLFLTLLVRNQTSLMRTKNKCRRMF